MKLIMENWRGYQGEILKEEEEMLLEANIADAIKNGFKKLMSAPGTFMQLVNRAKQNYKSIMREKLEKLASSPEMQKVAQQVATQINNKGANLNEVETASASSFSTANLEDLIRMGADEGTINKVATAMAGESAEAIIEAAEAAVGKPVPPRVRDWLVRFLQRSSKMVMFGFIDNFIMIVAGDQIDTNIARGMGWSAMAAAGMGNMISDMAGEEGGGVMDKTIEALGLDIEKVSDRDMRAAPGWMKFLDARAGTFGVAIGCIIGMVPLLFKEEDSE